MYHPINDTLIWTHRGRRGLRGFVFRKIQKNMAQWRKLPQIAFREIWTTFEMKDMNYTTTHKYSLIFSKRSFKKLQNKWMESNNLKPKCCYFYKILDYMFICSLEEKSHFHFLYLIYIRESTSILIQISIH